MERQHADQPEPIRTPAAPTLRMSEPTLLSLQRTAGNQAVCRAIASGMLAREHAAEKPISGLKVSPQKATLPLESGTAIKASAKGDGIKWSLSAGTVAPAAGTTIDEAGGEVTVDAKQPGGKLKAKATNSVSWAEGEFRVIEKPKDIASTSSSIAGQYEAHFQHTFTSSGAGQSGLEDANINEKFDAQSAKTPFGGDFKLKANAAGSPGWFLNAAGQMTTVDKVSISTGGIDAGPFVKNASNPAPAKTLPQGFTMTQKFHFRALPANKLEDAPFTTTEHVRRLVEKDGKLMVEIGAGKKSEFIPYVGPAVFRRARADKTTVEASPPKPDKGKWSQNLVVVTVDGEGAKATPKYSIVGEALGCTVDAASGVVKIGDKPGKITVRGGNAKNYGRDRDHDHRAGRRGAAGQDRRAGGSRGRRARAAREP